MPRVHDGVKRIRESAFFFYGEARSRLRIKLRCSATREERVRSVGRPEESNSVWTMDETQDDNLPQLKRKKLRPSNRATLASYVVGNAPPCVVAVKRKEDVGAKRKENIGVQKERKRPCVIVALTLLPATLDRQKRRCSKRRETSVFKGKGNVRASSSLSLLPAALLPSTGLLLPAAPCPS
jgi:hypothetical protein